MSKVIEAERELLNRLRAASRRILGPDASDDEIEARARRAYEGPTEPKRKLTPEEKQASDEELKEKVAEARRSGVMDI